MPPRKRVFTTSIAPRKRARVAAPSGSASQPIVVNTQPSAPSLPPSSSSHPTWQMRLLSALIRISRINTTAETGSACNALRGRSQRRWGSLLGSINLWAECNTTPKPQARVQKLSNDLDDAIGSLCNPIRAPTYTDEDEYTRWKRCEPVAEDSPNALNPTQYWMGLREQYSNLSRLALNVLSILALSCE
jgi:hypothetical protein